MCRSANSLVTDDGGRPGLRLCSPQTFRQKSELSPGHEDTREAGSRDSGGGCGKRAAWQVYADDPRPSQATPTRACLPAASATLGSRGSGCVGGALAPGLAPPPRPPIGRTKASSHAACLLARASKRRAPLVCSDLGTKFKDFKSTSWRLLRPAARRIGSPATSFLWSLPPPLHWIPSFCGMSRRTCSDLRRRSSCPCRLGARTTVDGECEAGMVGILSLWRQPQRLGACRLRFSGPQATYWARDWEDGGAGQGWLVQSGTDVVGLVRGTTIPSHPETLHGGRAR